MLLIREGAAAFRFEGRGHAIAVAGGFGIAGSALLVFVGLAMTRRSMGSKASSGMDS